MTSVAIKIGDKSVLLDETAAKAAYNVLAHSIHADNVAAGWWHSLEDGRRTNLLASRNRGEMLMLCITELSEAEEANDTYARDDKLPNHMGLHVEIADCAIRILDLLGAEASLHGGDPIVTLRGKHDYMFFGQAMSEFLQFGRRGVQGDLMRIARDLSKALDDGYRKGNTQHGRYWLSTAFYRIVALCYLDNIELFEIIEEKRAFNRQRADHKPENRIKEGGKKC